MHLAVWWSMGTGLGHAFPVFVRSSGVPSPTVLPAACADAAVAPQAAAAEGRQIPHRAAPAAESPAATGAVQLRSALRHCLLGLATS